MFSISSLNGKLLKFLYFSSNISSTESDVCVGKALTTIDRLKTIRKSNLSYKIKWACFQAVAVSVLLYSCTWTLMKHFKKKLNGNYKMMLL